MSVFRLLGGFAALTVLPAFAGTLLYTNSFTGQFGVINPLTGVFSSIGTTSAGELVAGPGGKLIYAVDETGKWGTVNPTTGNFTAIAAMNIAVDEFASTNDGKIFATSLDHGLYTVNPLTGQAMLLGPEGLTDPANGFLFTALVGGQTSSLYNAAAGVDGNTFALLSPTQFFQLNKSTGAGTLINSNIGALYLTCGIVIDGVVYAFDSNPVTGVTTEYSINPQTGQATKLFTIAGIDGVEGLALLDTPEPGTLGMALLAFGGLVAALRKRRA